MGGTPRVAQPLDVASDRARSHTQLVSKFLERATAALAAQDRDEVLLSLDPPERQVGISGGSSCAARSLHAADGNHDASLSWLMIIVSGMTEHFNAEQVAGSFFTTYAEALMRRDTAVIADHYAVPALIEFPEAAISVSQRTQTRAFFESALPQYHDVTELDHTVRVAASGPPQHLGRRELGLPRRSASRTQHVSADPARWGGLADRGAHPLGQLRRTQGTPPMAACTNKMISDLTTKRDPRSLRSDRCLCSGARLVTRIALARVSNAVNRMFLGRWADEKTADGTLYLNLTLERPERGPGVRKTTQVSTQSVESPRRGESSPHRAKCRPRPQRHRLIVARLIVNDGGRSARSRPASRSPGRRWLSSRQIRSV